MSKDLPLASAWMHPHLRFIATPQQRLDSAEKATKRRKQAA